MRQAHCIPEQMNKTKQDFHPQMVEQEISTTAFFAVQIKAAFEDTPQARQQMFQIH
jgi:hypothetical protein